MSMPWRFIAALAATAMLAIAAQAQSIPPGCAADLRCRCAVEAGGTYNPQTRRWRVEDENSMSWQNCLSRGLASQSAPPAKAKRSSKKSN
jgi:hypothetical protein